MKVIATVLSENSVFGNLGAIAEHGWAVFLETDYGNYLFDTGQGKTLINNVSVFKKDLQDIKGIILSHHHVDHTGGLMDAIEATGKPVDVYAHPDLFKEGYLVRKSYQYSGFEHGDTDIVQKTNEGYVIDSVMDDQSLIIKTEKGLFVLLGCAHAGIINILNYAVNKTGENRIHTIIGGTHLWSVSDEQKEKSIQALKEKNIQRLGVSHCTGFEVSMRLAQEFGQRFFHCNVGTIVEL